MTAELDQPPGFNVEHLFMTKRRAIVLAIVVAVGLALGWLGFNLGLDFLIGGRLF